MINTTEQKSVFPIQLRPTRKRLKRKLRLKDSWLMTHVIDNLVSDQEFGDDISRVVGLGRTYTF